MPLVDKKDDLHHMIHWQTQLTISKFTQIEVQPPNNSNGLRGVIVSTLNCAHSSLNCPIQISTTYFILHFMFNNEHDNNILLATPFTFTCF